MQVLLNLLAGVALLVWGTNIVRASILRLYGGDLRRVLRQSVSSRFAAFAAGLGVTALMITILLAPNLDFLTWLVLGL